MKYQDILVTAAVTALAVPLLKALYDWAQAPAPTTKIGNSPKVVKVVAQTLSEHKGEDSPIVQAFAEALQDKPAAH